MKKIATLLLTLSLSLVLFFPAIPVRAEAPEDILSSVDISALTDKLKDSLDDIRAMSDEELKAEIRTLAEQYHLTLTDGQVEQLLRLCRQLTEEDESTLQDKLEEKKDQLTETIRKVTKAENGVENAKNVISSVLDTIHSFFGRVAGFFTQIIENLTE